MMFYVMLSSKLFKNSLNYISHSLKIRAFSVFSSVVLSSLSFKLSLNKRNSKFKFLNLFRVFFRFFTAIYSKGLRYE